MLKNKPNLFERFFARMLPFDHLTLIYSWIMVVIIVNFARPLDRYVGILLFYLGVTLLIILLVQLFRPEGNRVGSFFRLLYPIMVMTAFYQVSGRLVHLFVPGFYDYQIAVLEKSIFGGDPSLWLDRFSGTFLTELLSASYFSYYFLVPGLALYLFFDRRDRELKRFLTATCVTFFISYLVFIFYPVEGPRHYFGALYATKLDGPIFHPLVDLVIGRGAFHGGAMPSSHVAEALVVMLCAIRWYGRKAYFLVAVVAALALGTIYGRFHYVTDVVIGVVIGATAYWLVLAFYPLTAGSDRQPDITDEEIAREYVSDNI